VGDELLFRFFRIVRIQQDEPAEMMVAVQIELGKFYGQAVGPRADDFPPRFDDRRILVRSQPDNDAALGAGRRRIG